MEKAGYVGEFVEQEKFVEEMKCLIDDNVKDKSLAEKLKELAVYVGRMFDYTHIENKDGSYIYEQRKFTNPPGCKSEGIAITLYIPH